MTASQTSKKSLKTTQVQPDLFGKLASETGLDLESDPVMVIDQNGVIQFGNMALMAFLTDHDVVEAIDDAADNMADVSPLIGQNADDMLAIIERLDVGADVGTDVDGGEKLPAKKAPSSKKSKSQFVSLKSGAYRIAFKPIGDMADTSKIPGDAARIYQFDWVEHPKAGRYLIGSEVAERLDFLGFNPSDRALKPAQTAKQKSTGQPHFGAMDTSDDAQAQDVAAQKQANMPEEALIGAVGIAARRKGPLAAMGGVERRADDPWQFLNLSSEIMVVLHDNGDVARVNNSFYTLMGCDDGQCLEGDSSLFTFIHDEDRAQARRNIQALAHGDVSENEPVEFEVRMCDLQGHIHWIEWRMNVRNHMIYGVGHDLTAEKDHEKALQKREMELSEAQKIGRMGHWNWAVGATDIEWSAQIYRIFGVNEDEFHPTMDAVNAMLHRRDVGRLLQAFQRAIIEQNSYEMDFRVNRPDGGVRYVRCEGRCEIDDEGEVVALFGIMQDITERVKNEKKLREAKDAAERAYSAKSQFLANMSHELRTPLNAIIGFSEMMQRQLLGPIGNEKYLDYITGIRESGEHLLDLISDILDMSKIEAGKYQLDLELLNLSKIIRLAIHMMEGRAHDSGIALSANIENEDIHIRADRRALMQIMLNILSNAVKFTKENGKVMVGIFERDEYVSIRIQDTGIGIPAHKIPQVVRPFEQVSSHLSRDHQGSGLGLSITKELIELHKGHLMIESELDKGTLVKIRLPYDPENMGDHDIMMKSQ